MIIGVKGSAATTKHAGGRPATYTWKRSKIFLIFNREMVEMRGYQCGEVFITNAMKKPKPGWRIILLTKKEGFKGKISGRIYRTLFRVKLAALKNCREFLKNNMVNK